MEAVDEFGSRREERRTCFERDMWARVFCVYVAR